MLASVLQFYFETDSWLWPLAAIASLGAFWIYHRRVLFILKKQQRALEENEHWLHEAQQIANIGSWYRYLDNGQSRWSPQLRRIYGVDDSAEPSFELFCAAVHPEDRAYVEQSIRRIEQSGDTTVLNFRVRRRDGSVSYVENRIKGAFDAENRLVAIYGSVLDVTERKAYEDSLKQIVAEAESANRAKGAFLSTVSHEIRTPLNAIIGFSTLMAEQELSLAQYRSYGESINAAGKSLSALINDVLDLSALESLSFRLVPVNSDIHRIMDEVASVFRLIVSDKGIALNIDVAANVPILFIDAKRLRQIMINMIGNAVKFTEEGCVEVRIHADFRREGSACCDLVIQVTDTGIGISPVDQSRIFSEFEQARSAVNRRYGGSGLGLSIVNQLLELMGGTITLDSDLGRGSTFTVSIYDVPLVSGAEVSEALRAAAAGETDTVELMAAEFSSGAVARFDSPPDCGLTAEMIAQLRCEFGERFSELAQGVNIGFARRLSADLHAWSCRSGDANLIKFAETFFHHTSSMNVSEMLRMATRIAEAQ
jgi:two-component system, NarL family, sensor histidine kinase EvgS